VFDGVETRKDFFQQKTTHEILNFVLFFFKRLHALSRFSLSAGTAEVFDFGRLSASETISSSHKNLI